MNVRVNNNQMCLTGGGELTATEIQVPSDISSSAFFMVAAAIAPQADVTLTGVNVNPTRTGVIDIANKSSCFLCVIISTFAPFKPWVLKLSVKAIT